MQNHNETQANQYGYMRQKELMTILPFSSATLWRMVKAGSFVKPVKLTPRITAWSRKEVHKWVSQKGVSL